MPQTGQLAHHSRPSTMETTRDGEDSNIARYTTPGYRGKNNDARGHITHNRKAGTTVDRPSASARSTHVPRPSTVSSNTTAHAAPGAHARSVVSILPLCVPIVNTLLLRCCLVLFFVVGDTYRARRCAGGFSGAAEALLPAGNVGVAAGVAVEACERYNNGWHKLLFFVVTGASDKQEPPAWDTHALLVALFFSPSMIHSGAAGAGRVFRCPLATGGQPLPATRIRPFPPG